jgi:hypothetical protein
MRPHAPQLDDTNSKLYHPKPVPKHAVLFWEPATYHLSWGIEHFDEPHMRVDEGDGKYCGCELRAFFDTHRALAEQRDHYVKDAVVRALQTGEDMDIVAEANGQAEMVGIVRAGCWIIQNPAGEQYYDTPEAFQRRYEPA